MEAIDFSRTKLSDAAMKFMVTFLRFEFALKEDGFCHKEGKAEVDWGTVTKTLGDKFYSTVRKCGAAKTVMQRPPKQQIAYDHKLGWEVRDPPANCHDLFEAVRRVRNNLVHGGKSGDPETVHGDPQRSEKLIAEAQWIVEQALCEMPDVRARFEGTY
jgi:hypothetical protein